MPQLNEDVETWIGKTVTDASGHKIGKIDDVYTDDDTGRPEWLAITSGLMGPSIHFVPMRGATVSGGGVQVPFPKDRVKVAPSAGADGKLSRMEKGRLYAHYGYSFAEERNRLQRSLGSDPPVPSGPAEGPETSRPVDLRAERRPVPMRDLSGPEGTVRPPARPDVAVAPPPRQPAPLLAEVRDMRPPEDRTEAEGRPAAVQGGSRGRWPDDDAIFGLIQDVVDPTGGLVTSGGSRRR